VEPMLKKLMVKSENSFVDFFRIKYLHFDNFKLFSRDFAEEAAEKSAMTSAT
jgi:hypothetical protein